MSLHITEWILLRGYSTDTGTFIRRPEWITQFVVTNTTVSTVLNTYDLLFSVKISFFDTLYSDWSDADVEIRWGFTIFWTVLCCSRRRKEVALKREFSRCFACLLWDERNKNPTKTTPRNKSSLADRLLE